MRAAVRDEHGFTLIELLITILIIGILAAIGLGVYNGQRAQAYNSQAKNSLRTALAAAESHYSEHESYMQPGGHYGGQPELDPQERSLKWAYREAEYWGDTRLGDPGHGSQNPGKNADPNEVEAYVWGPTPDTIYLCAVSKGNQAYCLVRSHDDNDTRTCYGDFPQETSGYPASDWAWTEAENCTFRDGWEH